MAAAKQEGKIVISGPPADGWREATMTLQQEFPEIEVEYTALTTRDFYARIEAERQAGVYAWDVRIGDPDADAYRARDTGMLEPSRPALFLPEVLDDVRWYGGVDGLFGFEKERRWFAGFMFQLDPVVWVNRTVIPPGELRSAKELRDPKWVDQIVLQDPRAGAGLGHLTVLLQSYGEEFVRDLLGTGEIAVNGDVRELSERVIQGEYPIGIGYNTELAKRLLVEAVIANVSPVDDGPIGVSPGLGLLQLISRPPHPNAVKLFSNWLLTARVQDRIAQAVGNNSRRADVRAGDLFLSPDPARLNEYICPVCEDLLPVRARALSLAQELIK